MSKTYLKSDHFNGGGSFSISDFAPILVMLLLPLVLLWLVQALAWLLR
jgi:hypothetical protein